jgi:4-hydroxy-tetrahydrodipicolinate reductase
MSTRVLVHGAAGRMGRALVEAVRAAPDLALAAGVDRPDHPELGRELEPGVKLTADAAAALRGADVAIDFSLPAAAVALVELAAGARLPLVIATTGLDAAQQASVRAAAARIPVVMAPNFSIGVNVLLRLVAEAARLLPDYDVDVLECHHVTKVDAPSGTALALGRAVAQARGQDFDAVAVYHRQGHTGVRRPGSIGMQTLRLGDSPGEHTVYFAGPGERIELSSRALSRANFAGGACRAARWVIGKSPGFYSMLDVLR